MSLRYRVKYEWPCGKVRYHRGQHLCVSPENAEILTLHEASIAVKKAKDAYTVWRIITTKERVK